MGTFTLKAQAAPGLPCTGNEAASDVRGLARGDRWLQTWRPQMHPVPSGRPCLTPCADGAVRNYRVHLRWTFRVVWGRKYFNIFIHLGNVRPNQEAFCKVENDKWAYSGILLQIVFKVVVSSDSLLVLCTLICQKPPSVQTPRLGRVSYFKNYSTSFVRAQASWLSPQCHLLGSQRFTGELQALKGTTSAF